MTPFEHVSIWYFCLSFLCLMVLESVCFHYFVFKALESLDLRISIAVGILFFILCVITVSVPVSLPLLVSKILVSFLESWSYWSLSRPVYEISAYFFGVRLSDGFVTLKTRTDENLVQ